jgi:DNA-binding NarL/FixJ family response regulator
MVATHTSGPIQIGLITAEPIRLEGLMSIFDQPTEAGHIRMIPVSGTLAQLLANRSLEYLIVDLNSSSNGLETLETIRRLRPTIRQIVIGPEGNDQLVLEAIVAGARAYLDLSAGPESVRIAIEAVVDGTIWAPRRLLSKLIDRLLTVRDASLTNASASLTSRERQVLDLILMARSNREIARQLGIEERTVKAHVGRLMRKTGSDNRIELTMHALSGSHLADYSSSKPGNGINPSWYVTEE